ncbi:MAG: hypothetical protein NHG08_00040 [Candidatus Shikimatogenerans sp. JK-2022]|nr:hypothetical protein [Candidatus Shikimatogenerans bostrichidophilus]
MIKKQLKKILKLRKITKFSIILCKNSLIKNNWNIKKTIKYLRKNEFNNKINIKKYKFNFCYSKINKKCTLGHIIKFKVINEDTIKNKKLLILLKKILYISIKKKCKNIKELYNEKIYNKKIKNKLLDYSIMLKDKILIKKFKILKSNFIYNYNHFNNKLSSLIGFKFLKNIKFNNNIKRIIKYISLDIISNNKNKKQNINKYNIYYHSNKIDPFLLERIDLNIKKFLKIFKYIIIYKYYIFNN